MYMQRLLLLTLLKLFMVNLTKNRWKPSTVSPYTSYSQMKVSLLSSRSITELVVVGWSKLNLIFDYVSLHVSRVFTSLVVLYSFYPLLHLMLPLSLQEQS